ncbi:hypothetical protein AK830_g8765 [Neonectria ditissima]|uniref:Uncharacterized protein n=1 Tax=Neonectria ditissima TaxID=78410 RepID=A0A0P7BBJ8_9HYPO|nr:hypothetical protein AK830_g8765 [Neonectria ditissima]
MALPKLKLVKERDNVTIYTEHSDRIHPRDLSNSLLSRFGENGFEISMRRNIYVVYIVDKKHSISSPAARESDTAEDNALGTVLRDCQKRLEDVKEAEGVLMNARLCKVY